MKTERSRFALHGAWVLGALWVSWCVGAPAQAEEGPPSFEGVPPFVTEAIEEAVAEPSHPESTFDEGVDGWTSSDGPQGLAAVDGVLQVSDITEDWLWLSAPDGFIGNWRSFARIAFSLRADTTEAPRYPVQLEIRGPGGHALCELHDRFAKQGTWRRISVPLEAAGWRLTGDWQALLENVRSLRVRLDLHGGTDALETHALDDVRLIRPRHSTFDVGVDGWRVEGGVLENGGGHLEVVDHGAGWCWIRAPRTFEGDWRGLASVSLDVRADARGEIVQPLRLQIESPHGMAILNVPIEAVQADAWRRLTLPLDPERWNVSGTWRESLASVEAFWIRVDLTTAHDGGESTSLDDIRLVRPSLADPPRRTSLPRTGRGIR